MVDDTDFVDFWTEVPVATIARTLRIHSLRSSVDVPVGPSIVCVPGLGASAETMLPTARLLTRLGAVHILDLPGDGRSETPRNYLTMADYAAVCGGWLETQAFPTAVWVGHSFGTQVLVELASERPAFAERLVLISPTVDPNARTLLDQLGKLARDGLHEPAPLLRILIRDYARTGFRRLRAIGHTALADNVEGKLPEIKAPTLVIRGDNDPLVPEAWAERMVTLLPDGHLVVIEGAPHAVQYVEPGEVADAITRFLTCSDADARTVGAPAIGDGSTATS